MDSSMNLQATSLLCCLPDEIIIHILSMLHPPSLVTCRAVCQLALKFIDHTMILQYLIELFAEGMVDPGHAGCHLTVAERLSLLRDRRLAWKELKWTQCVTPLIPGSWSAYELVDGIFSKTLDSSGSQNARGILFTTLPSRDASGSLTTIPNVGIPFRDFAMDPTQDLIVYMRCERLSTDPDSSLETHVTLHFRTFDNRVHPGAVRPLVGILLVTDVLGAVIQTVNDMVGFMAWDNMSAQLYIWNWKKCTLLVSETHMGPIDDFAFLSDRAYVLTSPTPEPRFRVYTFDATAYASPRPPTLRATLHLPPLRSSANASLLGIHTGPFTTSASPSRGPPKPFIRASHRRIHVANIELSPGPDVQPVPHLIVIHNRSFLAYTTQEPAVDVSWAEWGSDQTRWISGGTGSSWLRYVHGERLVRMHSAARVLEVYDFGMVAQREAMSDSRTLPFLDSVFATSVVGRLPCRIVSKRGSFPYSGFMIDEERLIGLKRHWADDLESVDVFTF